MHLRESLTAREFEILDLVKKGALNKEIAVQLFISIETVKKHLKNIYSKLNVRNRIEATLIVFEMRA